MRKIKNIILGLALAITMVVPVYATGSDTASDIQATIDTSKKGQITIDYSDDADGKKPVSGAKFTYYKIADIGTQGEYKSVINGIEITGDTKAKDILRDVKAAYKSDVTDGATYDAETDSDGHAVTELEQGAYLAEEVKPAKKHKASEAFIFAVPYTTEKGWQYEVTVRPKASLIKDKKKTTPTPAPGNGNGNGQTNKNMPLVKTGDNMRVFYYIALALGTMLVIFAGVKKRRNEKENS